MATTSFHPPSPLDTPNDSIMDFHSSPPPFAAAAASSTPAPVIVHSRPAKKRKSWGQELPEPKTTLPPRKRAKTDDEKEQRRIERIKRNRAAAHNSRERKRQETETYAVALARAQAELDAYRQHFGALPSNIVLPEVTLSTLPEEYVSLATPELAALPLTPSPSDSTPAPSLIESRGSVIVGSPASPALHDDLFEPTHVTIKQEPDITFTPSFDPPSFALPESTAKSHALALLDPTQHSAAMLCDLQCRSRQPSSTTLPPFPPSFWATLFLHLTRLSLTTTSKSLLLAIWSLSPSRTARLMQASPLPSTSPSTTSSRTPRPLSRSTPRALAQRNAATCPPRVGPQLEGAFPALVQSRLQSRRVDEVPRLREGGQAEAVIERGVAFRESSSGFSANLGDRERRQSAGSGDDFERADL